MFCANCGVKNESNSNFCQGCGAKIERVGAKNSETVTKTRVMKMKPKKIALIAGMIITLLIASILVYLYVNRTIDYAKLYYKYLSEINYGETADWMNAELVDLDDDGIPELVAAYGDQFELYDDYEGADKKTGSLSVFKYMDKKIIEYEEPKVLNYEKKEEESMTAFSFNTNYNLRDSIGGQSKNIYIKSIDETAYLFVELDSYQRYESNHSITGYRLSSTGKLVPKIQVKKYEILSSDYDRVVESGYKYNGKTITEMKFNKYIESYQLDDAETFMIHEFGYEGGLGYGDDLIYGLTGSNYHFAMNLSEETEADFFSKKEKEKLQADLQQARELLEDRKFDEALDVCNNILSIDFNSEDALLLKAEVLYEEYKFLEANKLLNRLLTFDPDSSKVKQLVTKERDYTVNKAELKAFVKKAQKTGRFGPFHANLIGQRFDKIAEIFGEPTDVYYASCTECDDFDQYFYGNYFFKGFNGKSWGLSVYVDQINVNDLINIVGEPDSIEDGMWLSYDYIAKDYTISAIIGYNDLGGPPPIERLAIYEN